MKENQTKLREIHDVLKNSKEISSLKRDFDGLNITMSTLKNEIQGCNAQIKNIEQSLNLNLQEIRNKAMERSKDSASTRNMAKLASKTKKNAHDPILATTQSPVIFVLLPSI
jgi:dsDNA-specific endonuclease/ATPase MutS2